MLKLELDNVRIDQSIDFWRAGSIRGGTIKCGAQELTLHVEVVSDEPPEKIAELVRIGKESCFTHGTLTEVVPVRTTTSLNGDPLEV